MNRFRNLLGWIILAGLCAWLFLPAPAIRAQALQTITATGIMTKPGGEEISFDMTFPPAGGPVTAILVLETTYLYDNGNDCNVTMQVNWEGTFEGGDGGAASGTTTQSITANDCAQDLEFDTYGAWNGHFYADGTGNGIFDWTLRALNLPYDYYQAPWQVTFSADEFAAALNPGAPVADTPQPYPPENPGEVITGQPEEPPNPVVPTNPGGLFGIPIPVVVGSLGIPVAGAFVGAALAALLSALSSAGASSAAATSAGASLAAGVATLIPGPGQANGQALYWSERPWDQAGPGYVTKEEFERTKDMLAQGYKWTNGGWQTPDQVNQWDQAHLNDQAAVARVDAGWKAKVESEKQALQQREAELKRTTDALELAHNIEKMKDALKGIDQRLKNEGVYVANPFQGDPTLILDGYTKGIISPLWDGLSGDTGLTCQGYVERTSTEVEKIVLEKFGPDAKVQRIQFVEKSSVAPEKGWLNPKAYRDWFDSINPDNHDLLKVTLPDKSEWAVDFHQHNTGTHPPIMRPWKKAKKIWQDYMGDEFVEEVPKSVV